jgi:hypothetical protein
VEGDSTTSSSATDASGEAPAIGRIAALNAGLGTAVRGYRSTVAAVRAYRPPTPRDGRHGCRQRDRRRCRESMSKWSITHSVYAPGVAKAASP